jgi:hypothetical protein
MQREVSYEKRNGTQDRGEQAPALFLRKTQRE